MPRILLVGRDPIRGLIDTAGADQGPRQRSKLLRVRRIPGAVGVRVLRSSGNRESDRPRAAVLPCAARPEAQSAHRLGSDYPPAAALRRPSKQGGEPAVSSKNHSPDDFRFSG